MNECGESMARYQAVFEWAIADAIYAPPKIQIVASGAFAISNLRAVCSERNLRRHREVPSLHSKLIEIPAAQIWHVLELFF